MRFSARLPVSFITDLLSVFRHSEHKAGNPKCIDDLFSTDTAPYIVSVISMTYTHKLFSQKDIYDIDASNQLFVQAMKENAVFHYNNCSGYKNILDHFGFDPNSISCFDDLIRLPFIPTLYFKHHHLQSISPKKQIIKATSSGTSGSKSTIGFDLRSLNLGKKMVINVGKYHKLWSKKPTNYIIFGYQPTKENKTAVSKTAYGFTFSPLR